jgi:hypothetical protein
MNKFPDFPSYKVSTELAGAGRILQTTVDLAGELYQRWIDTQEAGVRAKLIELGWMPPEEARALRAELERLTSWKG